METEEFSSDTAVIFCDNCDAETEMIKVLGTTKIKMIDWSIEICADYVCPKCGKKYSINSKYDWVEDDTIPAV